MDGEGEHHVGDCQGDDENIRGFQFLPSESDDEDDEEVEEKTHNDCNIILTVNQSGTLEQLYLTLSYSLVIGIRPTGL